MVIAERSEVHGFWFYFMIAIVRGRALLDATGPCGDGFSQSRRYHPELKGTIAKGVLKVDVTILGFW